MGQVVTKLKKRKSEDIIRVKPVLFYDISIVFPGHKSPAFRKKSYEL